MKQKRNKWKNLRNQRFGHIVAAVQVDRRIVLQVDNIVRIGSTSKLNCGEESYELAWKKTD